MRLRSARYGHAAEWATEEILEDLFTTVLDWSIRDLNHQVGYADLLLSRLGIKYLIVETKHPGAFAWSRPAVNAALCQAWGYACEQKVQSIAISDGHMLYAADIEGGHLRGRAFVRLDSAECETDLWWLSVDGIYQRPPEGTEARLQAFLSRRWNWMAQSRQRVPRPSSIRSTVCPPPASPTLGIRTIPAPGHSLTGPMMGRSTSSDCPKLSRRSSATTGVRTSPARPKRTSRTSPSG
jgi:hypothetical protein